MVEGPESVQFEEKQEHALIVLVMLGIGARAWQYLHGVRSMGRRTNACKRLMFRRPKELAKLACV